MNDPAKNPYVASSSAPGQGFSGGQRPSTINAAATTGTVISLALIGGVFMITAILTFMIMSDPPEDESLIRFDGDAILFLGIGYGVFLASAVAAVVLRGITKGQAVANLKASDEEMPQPLDGNSTLPPSGQAFLGAVATYTLIGQALMEGPAVVNAILMFVENNFAHVIPIILGAIGIALQIPTAGKLKTLIEDVKRGREF